MSTKFFVRNTGILKRERPLGAEAERQCWFNRILKTKDFEVENSFSLRHREISDMVGLVRRLELTI